MARIELGDTNASLTGSLRAASGVTSDGTAQARGAAQLQRGLGQFAAGAKQVNDMVVAAEIDHQTRRNERIVLDAETRFDEFRRDLMLGEGGALQTQGSDADGATKGLNEKLHEQMGVIEQELENSVQRRAFKERASRSAASAAESSARHEAHQLELSRRSTAVARLEQREQDLTTIERGRWLNPDQVAEEISDAEEWISASQPQLSDEAVTNIARQWARDTALKATIGMLSDGPDGIPQAERMLKEWEDLWTPEQVEAVTNKLNEEFGYSIMDQIVANVAVRQGVDGDPLAVSMIAGDVFKIQFERATGREAPDKLVQAQKRRATSFYNLVEESARKEAGAREDAQMTQLYKVFAAPDSSPAERSAILEQIWKETNNPDVLKAVSALQENHRKTGTIFAPAMTAEGYIAMEQMGQDNPPKSLGEALSAVSRMDKTNGEAFLKVYLASTKTTGQQAPQKDLSEAIKLASTDIGAHSYKAGTSQHTLVLARLRDAETEFVKENRRVPDLTELRGMARAIGANLDDVGPMDGAGSIGEFLSDPTGNPLVYGKGNDKDAQVLRMVASILETNPNLAKVIIPRLEQGGPRGRYKAAKDLIRESPEKLFGILVQNPEAVADVIRFAIATNAVAVSNNQTFSSIAQGDLRN